MSFGSEYTTTSTNLTCVDGVGMVDEMVPPPEGLVAKLALEAFPAVHRLDVGVQAPLAHQSPAAGT